MRNLKTWQKKEDDNIKKFFPLKKSVLKYLTLVCASALTLTAVSCSDIKKSQNSIDNTTSNSETVSQENDKKEDIIITMAISTNIANELKEEIDSFNSSDNGYQIVTKCYDSDFYDEDGMQKDITQEERLSTDFNLIQDIINTDSIDIIASNAFYGESKYEILKNKGAFADLYPFMENDAEVNTSTLNQHILSLNETDGKLCSIPVFYTVTTLVGEEKYVGNKENWTVDDFIFHWEQMPEGSTVNGSKNSEYIYYTVLRANLESFIDYENAKVNFDSSEFRKILEFCNRFPSNNGQKGEYDYESPRLVNEYNLNGIMSARLFGKAENVISNTEPPYTMVGFPSSNGEGAFFSDMMMGRYSISIKSSPEKQKGAWEFIRTLYTEEYQVNNVIEKYVYNYDGKEVTSFSTEFGFCINNNAFEKTAQKIMNNEYYDGKYTDKGVEYTYDMPTQEEIDKIIKYLNSINRWETRLDRALWEIINDEVMAYFAGKKTLDDTVDMIQNRASVWISEQS